MRTYKEKAEKYVREKLPELMELSFGCEVFIPITKNSSMHGKQGFGTVTHSYKGVRTSWSGYDATNDNISVYMYNSDVYRPCISMKKNKVGIIGHPIQLQHWLRVLEEHKHPGIYPTLEIGFQVVRVRSSEENSRCVAFNLTTGQPATEADYGALCNILGI